jgi:hypothetical protein
MIRQYIYLPRYDWKCWVYYAVDSANADEIILQLNYIGCHKRELDNAWENLTASAINSGLTYSNFIRGESVIVIADTSTAEEFAKSWQHEIGHLATHIATAFDIDLKGEEVRYITDDIVGEMWSISRQFLCDCCKKKAK